MAAGIKPKNEDVPLPYRVLSKDYMTGQLPHLEEKAPMISQAPLELSTNAPSTLPSPSLFPGEILRMQQHRAVCTNAFSEAAVGVVYLTNFRLIFNGNPASDAEMFEIIRDLQFHSASAKKSEPPGHYQPFHPINNIKTTINRYKKHQPVTPRTSKFYIGDTNDDSIVEDDADNKTSQSLPGKLLQRINTLRRSSKKPVATNGDDNKTRTKADSLSVESTVPIVRPVSPSVGSSPSPSRHGNSPDLPKMIVPPQSDEIDFERAPMDFPINDKRRTHHAHQKRPTSIIALDSDSDSDTVTDKYFGSLGDEDDSDVTSPVEVSRHNYVNIVIPPKDEDTPVPVKDTPVPVKDTPIPVKDTPVPVKDTPVPVKDVPVPVKDTPVPVEDTLAPFIGTPTSGLPSNEEDQTSEQFRPAPPIKPPRLKKKLSGENPLSQSYPQVNESNQTHVRSHSDTLGRRRRPPPPPPKVFALSQASSPTSPKADDEVFHTSSSDPNLIDLSSADVINVVDRSSSLVANRGSVPPYLRRLTISSPREPSLIFELGKSSNKSYDTSSLPLLRDGVNPSLLPYYQYSYSVYMPLATINCIKHLPSTILDESGLKLPDGIIILGKNFTSLKLHLHPSNTYDAIKLKDLLEGIINETKQCYELFAFKYRAALRLPNPHILDSRKLLNFFHFDAEVARIGLLEAKIKNSALWRVTTVTKTEPQLCPSYPEKLVVLLCTPDVDLLRSVNTYQEGRFPTACWMHRSNGSVLLRAAATKSERGVQGSNLPVDEAILQAIRGCNANSRLFVFTERSDVSSFQDPNKLTAEAARSYYYHNCNFVFSINPPTFKSVRHSFNKLQAMLQNNVSDEEYLAALDNTKWLSRISDLLLTTYKVIEALVNESAHVLVCYENGWDRTTQIVSLAQLLCDPYYRTMDGFQVLIQKEWLWFGHPFDLRHMNQSNSKVKLNGPVFMQWIDCVWQIMRQCPFAFEFNEKFLIALVEYCYSKQFGTFLGNSEKERTQCFMIPDHYHQSVEKNTISLWTWVSMINNSNTVFFNEYYNPHFHTEVIYPKYYQTCLEIWRSHYDKYNFKKDIDNGSVDNNKLFSELRQLIRMFKERQCDSPFLSLQLGLKENALNPLAQLMYTYTDTNNTQQLIGPNPSLIREQSAPVPVKTDNKMYDSITGFLVDEGYDPNLCYNIILAASTCQGYLVKEGGFMKNWKRRWFVLDFNTEYLAYFETRERYNERDRPKGVIGLDQIKKVSLSTRRTHLMSNLFQIRTPARTYNIKAPSIVSMEMWIACLKLSPSQLKCISS